MRSLHILLFSLLPAQSIAKGHWGVQPGVGDAEKKSVIEHMRHVFKVAKIAADVLATDFARDAEVQKIASWTMKREGDSEEVFAERVAKAQGFFSNLGKYDPEPTDVSQGADPEDLIVVLKNPFILAEDINGQRFAAHRYTGTGVLGDNYDASREPFYTSANKPPPGGILALTESPIWLTPDGDRSVVYKAWEEKGRPDAGPDHSKKRAVHTDRPCSMDISRYFMVQISRMGGLLSFMERENGAPDGDIIFKKSVFTAISSRSFVAKFAKAQVEYLGFTLPGVMLHELTHSPLGGMTLDTPTGGSFVTQYSWEGAKETKTPWNAQTLTYLAIQLVAWKSGVQPQEDGSFVVE